MLLKAENITHSYRRPGLGRPRLPVLNGVNLWVDRGETVGLLGESGSGKTTLGRILTGLLRPDSGSVLLDGTPLRTPYTGQTRRRVQILFQHPESAFDPRMTLEDSLKEVYALCGLPYSRQALLEQLRDYGIYREHILRLPGQLSGGELQRLALARVLLLRPDFLVLDEPTSMLDEISQAQMMQMLLELQKKNGTAYLFITHDEALCRFVSRRIFLIQNGIVTEESPIKGETT